MSERVIQRYLKLINKCFNFKIVGMYCYIKKVINTHNYAKNKCGVNLI